MNCDVAREALSAGLDGEQAVPLSAEVNAHVAGCGDCRSWQEAAHRLTRRVRLTAAQPMADDTARILEAVIADRTVRRGARGRQLVRAGLAVAAMAQFVIIIPALVLGRAGVGVPPQAARELGAFNLALAVGFVVAALRPGHARGMLPLVGTATACLIVLSAINTAIGQTTLLAEVPHLIAVAGLVLLHLIADRKPTTYRRWLRTLTIASSRSAAARVRPPRSGPR
jgi:predicted anti-sigma-YlaC factor YlaD